MGAADWSPTHGLSSMAGAGPMGLLRGHLAECAGATTGGGSCRLLCLVPGVPVSAAAPDTRQPRETDWELTRALAAIGKAAVGTLRPPFRLLASSPRVLGGERDGEAPGKCESCLIHMAHLNIIYLRRTKMEV